MIAAAAISGLPAKPSYHGDAAERQNSEGGLSASGDGRPATRIGGGTVAFLLLGI